MARYYTIGGGVPYCTGLLLEITTLCTAGISACVLPGRSLCYVRIFRTLLAPLVAGASRPRGPLRGPALWIAPFEDAIRKGPTKMLSIRVLVYSGSEQASNAHYFQLTLIV